MIRERVRALLEDVAAGRATIDQALARLDSAPVEDLGFASIDHHRALRAGFPEVVFGEGKSVGQTVAICQRIAAQGDGFLLTRANASQLSELGKTFPALIVNETARTARIPGSALHKKVANKPALIITAGTSDLPVAEEAAETLAALNLNIARLTDVGVAGIHRLLSQHDALRDAGVVIVVAGMDGALPSVVGGLVRAPVIAVPTSVGYGASFQGLSALLAMLNSCAAGVTVCNIDNGFGAAMAAARILNAQ
jgi:NCAIR mutase (PurE)-related protein